MPNKTRRDEYAGGFPKGFEEFGALVDRRRGKHPRHYFGAIIFIPLAAMICGSAGPFCEKVPPDTSVSFKNLEGRKKKTEQNIAPWPLLPQIEQLIISFDGDGFACFLVDINDCATQPHLTFGNRKAGRHSGFEPPHDRIHAPA